MGKRTCNVCKILKGICPCPGEEKKKSAGLQFNISIRKLKLSVPQRRQESHAEMSPLKLPQVIQSSESQSSFDQFRPQGIDAECC